jgi:hypothetical protein
VRLLDAIFASEVLAPPLIAAIAISEPVPLLPVPSPFAHPAPIESANNEKSKILWGAFIDPPVEGSQYRKKTNRMNIKILRASSNEAGWLPLNE